MPDLKKCRILVTPTSFAKNDSSLRSDLEKQVKEVKYNTAGRPLTSDELLELIPGCDGYIAGLDDINRAVIAAADRLKVIARYGVGVDNVDLLAARQRGIVVTNTPGANAGAVAELTIGLMLALARDLPAAVQATKSGGWPRWKGLALEGKTTGLIGFGAVGQQVARRLRCFHCTILAYDPLVTTAPVELAEVQLLPLDEVTRRADFLSLHCPLTPDTRGMVGAGFPRAICTFVRKGTAFSPVFWLPNRIWGPLLSGVRRGGFCGGGGVGVPATSTCGAAGAPACAGAEPSSTIPKTIIPTPTRIGRTRRTSGLRTMAFI